MSTTKSINIRIDEDLKSQSDKVLSDLGLTTSAVVSMLLKTIVRNNAVPAELFTIREQARNNAEYLAKLDRSFAEYKAGLGQKHELLEVNDD